MHTILGAGGPVANALTAELVKNNHPVKLASRRPVTRFDKAEWIATDLLDSSAVMNAVKGSSVIYLTAGLIYNRNVWAIQWPQIIQNLIDAGRETGARLIFFDNVYSYGHVDGPMKEDSPYKPISVKGEIRAKIATRLMDESKKGNINATIARAADFYGAETLNSFFDIMVLQKYAKKKKSMYIGNSSAKHSLTYVPDAGRAMYVLGQNASSGNQVWHVPTAPALKGTELIKIAAEVFHMEPKYTTINKFMLQLVGLFQPQIAETAELYYQNKYDYIFDSSKFEKAFGVQPTSYREGMAEFAKVLNRQSSVVSRE